uniref:Uncharacterized protein n=1 Tax=Arundo donax TaxID=35708 RepID=A0A0A8Z5Q3_ARUDO
MTSKGILGYVIQINMIQEEQSISLPTIPPSIEQVLNKFAEVFNEPQGLPPHRECDHSIPLKQDAKPPNIRPYRVPHKQKDEVEKLIKSSKLCCKRGGVY